MKPRYRISKTWLQITHHPEAELVGRKSVRYAPHDYLPDHLETEVLENSHHLWVETREAAILYARGQLVAAMEKAAQQIEGRLRVLDMFDPAVAQGLPDPHQRLADVAKEVAT